MTNAFVTQPAGLIHDDDPEIMALRDYFAAMAMQGLLAANSCYGGKPDRWKLCIDSYAHADAMLKVREKNGNEK
jgi:hypothetical protein